MNIDLRLVARLQLQILAALRARPHVGVGGHGVGKRVGHLLGMGHAGSPAPGRAGCARSPPPRPSSCSPRRCGPWSASSSAVISAMGDVRRELVQRVDDGDAQLRGLDGVVLHVLHLVEALDDGGAGRFRAEAQLLHLLHELALGIARRRLGLLLRTGGAVEGDGGALGERRQLLVILQPVGVDGAEARLQPARRPWPRRARRPRRASPSCPPPMAGPERVAKKRRAMRLYSL